MKPNGTYITSFLMGWNRVHVAQNNKKWAQKCEMIDCYVGDCIDWLADEYCAHCVKVMECIKRTVLNTVLVYKQWLDIPNLHYYW